MAGCRAHNEVEAEKLTCEIVELENSIAHLVSLRPQELLGVFSSLHLCRRQSRYVSRLTLLIQMASRPPRVGFI